MYNLGTQGSVALNDYSTIPAQELILTCLRSGEEIAWVEFVRRFQPLIASVVLRVARQWGAASPQVIDDLVQETYLKLCAERCRLLQNFKTERQGAIYGFLKVFTANLARDHFKAVHAQKRGGSVGTDPLDVEVVSGHVTRNESEVACYERNILVGQVATCLNSVVSGPNATRDSRIFWLYYRVGLSASAIADLSATGLSTKGVESIILRLTRALRERLDSRISEKGAANRPVEGNDSAESY